VFYSVDLSTRVGAESKWLKLRDEFCKILKTVSRLTEKRTGFKSLDLWS